MKVEQAIIVENIEKILNLFPEVLWDRFGGSLDDMLAVYGWIEREDHKWDYIQLIFEAGEICNYCTSSAKYSKDFGQRLGSASHQDCQRVEHTFKNVKAVRVSVVKPL